MFESITVQSKGGRPYQEDRFMVSPTRVVVCDGMGGHQGGADAAEAAVRALWDSRKHRPGVLLEKAIADVHQAVAQLGKDTRRRDMGCTLITVEAKGSEVHWGHVGDSRIYWWRDKLKLLNALTIDHTTGGALLQMGKIDTQGYEEDHAAPGLLSCIGGGMRLEDLTIDTGSIRPGSGDLLLCMTDGVFGPLKFDLRVFVAKAAANWKNAEAVCREILDESERRKDTDNKTLVMSRWF